MEVPCRLLQRSLDHPGIATSSPSTPESRAYLYFTGVDTLTLYAVARDTYGSAELWVDGQRSGTFNLYSANVKYNVPYTVTGLNPTKDMCWKCGSRI